MDNLKLYNAVRKVPDDAKKQIMGGRLKGMTDVNPMFRIKTLTEQFGPCGVGWYTEILERREMACPAGEVMCFMDINLYYRDAASGEWSKPIFGTGGSSLIAKEKSGLYASDEGWKMAYTDALSVACKALGIAADVYWASDRTKYSTRQNDDENAPDGPVMATDQQKNQLRVLFTPERLNKLFAHYRVAGMDALTYKQAESLISARFKEINAEKEENTSRSDT